MKVCVLGAGSLGSTIGGALAKAGNEVHFVGRAPHMNAINENGLVMVTPTGEETVRLSGHTTPDGIGPCDLVIVLCKAFDTAKTMEEGRGLVGPNTTVMSLQNGLGAEDVLCDCVGAEHVIGGKTYIGGMLLEPGRVQATIPGKDTFIGELDGSVTERTRAIGAAFEEAGMHCIVSDNIMGVIWDKLLVNVATGAVCGITHLPYGDMYEEEKLVACSCAAVQEGMDVAKAAGVKLTGFDSLEECFGDLSGEIHAVETGLSSDPPMNWRVPDCRRASSRLFFRASKSIALRKWALSTVPLWHRAPSTTCPRP